MAQQMTAKEVPHDNTAECAVVGSLIYDPDGWERLGGLVPTDFFDPRLRVCFTTLCDLHRKQQPLSFPILCTELGDKRLAKLGGEFELDRLIRGIEGLGTVSIGYYAGVVKTCALQRAYLATASRVAKAAYAHEGTPAELQERMASIWEQATPNIGDPVQTHSLADILDNVGDPAPDIVAGFIHGEATIIFSGDGGIGKGYTTLDMAFRVAQGLDWLGMTTRKVNVLIVDVENQQARIRKRILEIMGGHALDQPPDNVHIAFNLHSHLDEAGFVPELVALAKRHQVGLIILDSLSDFLGNLDENSNPDMTRVAGKLRAIRDQTGATIMAQHHVSKASAGKSYQTSRGASSLFDNVDVDIQVMRDGPLLTMTQKKNRLGVEMRVTARLNWGLGMFNLSPVSTQIGRAQRSAQGDKDEAAILDLLKGGQWWPSNEVVAEVQRVTSHARNTIHGKLRLLVGDAILERDGKGPGAAYQVRLILPKQGKLP